MVAQQKVREAFVNNTTLSYLSAHYGLSAVAVCSIKSAGHLRESQNLAADLFEAHIGGLYLDLQAQGKRDVWERWIFDVFSPDVFPDVEALGAGFNDVFLTSRTPGRNRADARPLDDISLPFLVPAPPSPSSHPQAGRKRRREGGSSSPSGE